MEPADRDLRLLIYEHFARRGVPPERSTLLKATQLSDTTLAAALQRLANLRAIALKPGSTEIWMAHPFSAVPTPYRVRTRAQSYWANCAWDVLGIAALLDEDVSCECLCPDCDEALDFRVQDRRPRDGDWVIHFAVRPSRFWENVGFT